MSVYITAPDGTSSWLTKLYMRITGSLSFSANKNSVNQSIPNSGSPNLITWSTLDYDTTGGFDTANSKWVCKQGGIYSFNVTTTLTTTLNITESFNLYIYKNGVLAADNQFSAPADFINPILTIVRDFKLNINDYIEVKVFQSSGGAVNLDGSSLRTYFQGKRVT